MSKFCPLRKKKPMQFDLDNYKGKFVMHCRTRKEAKGFCKYLHEHGRMWCDGISYKTTDWKIFAADTAYYFNEGWLGSVNYATDYTVLEWKDFVDNIFTKIKRVMRRITNEHNNDRHR